MHNSIAVKEVVAKRGIILDTSCPMCHSDFESLSHALRDCSVVKSVWIQLGSHYLNPYFFSQGTREWLISNSNLKSSQNAAGIPWNILFSYAIWMIWKQRNRACFSNKKANPNLVKVITMQAMEFMLCASKPTRNNHLVVKQASWEKPDPGWIKLNTDGSSSGSVGIAVGGGLIRDEFGNWLIGFSRKEELIAL